MVDGVDGWLVMWGGREEEGGWLLLRGILRKEKKTEIVANARITTKNVCSRSNRLMIEPTGANYVCKDRFLYSCDQSVIWIEIFAVQ